MKRSKKPDWPIYILLWLLLAGVVFGLSKLEAAEKTTEPTSSPSPQAETATTEVILPEESELVGLWVPYFELQAEDEEEFRENFTAVVTKAEKAGVNALFVHVRAFCDALYESEIYPPSHLIGGEQGAEFSFDPLKFMVEASHEKGMEFHAWINPLRVAGKETPGDFSTDSIYSSLRDSCPYYFIETESGIYLDPAYSYVRQIVAAGAEEIAENYEVDGIHFDDYFYPSDMGNQDELAYMSYLDMAVVPLPVEDWRIANINTMVSETYRAIKKVDPEISFGISPQGNIGNNAALGADVEAWCAVPGYVDYICPQIYFSFENEALGFEDCLDSWISMEKHETLKIYIGLALYKVGTDSDGGTWSEDSSEILEQKKKVKKAKADGVVYFDSSDIDILLD